MPILPAAADPGTINFLAVAGNGSGNLSVTVTSDDQLNRYHRAPLVGRPDTGTHALDLSDFTEQDTFIAGVQPRPGRSATRPTT